MSSDWPTGGTARMLALVTGLVDDLEAAAHLPGLDTIGAQPADCRRMVLCGMGGSAIAGDLVQPLLDASGIQLVVRRDYGLPAWTTAEDLVIAVSYSGNTEETLAGLAEARERGCRIVSITSGGELEALALGADGFPRVKLPTGLPPRAALGHGLGALLHVLHRLGAIADPAQEIAAAADELRARTSACLAPWTHERYAEPVPATSDVIPVAALAELLTDRIPVLYTAGAEAHAVGVRWKAQLNENSKIPALVVAFPELDHNDLVGWDLSESLRERFVLVILESGVTDSRDRIRRDATAKLLANEFSSIHRIVATGDSALARVLSLVQYGDYLSCHIAHRRAVDPMPVERIENLKSILSRGGNP